MADRVRLDNRLVPLEVGPFRHIDGTPNVAMRDVVLNAVVGLVASQPYASLDDIMAVIESEPECRTSGGDSATSKGRRIFFYPAEVATIIDSLIDVGKLCCKLHWDDASQQWSRRFGIASGLVEDMHESVAHW